MLFPTEDAAALCVRTSAADKNRKEPRYGIRNAETCPKIKDNGGVSGFGESAVLLRSSNEQALLSAPGVHRFSLAALQHFFPQKPSFF